MSEIESVMLDWAASDTPDPNPRPSEDKCPKCGSPTMSGYGLMGGGIGLYWLCENTVCDYFHKEQDKDE